MFSKMTRVQPGLPAVRLVKNGANALASEDEDNAMVAEVEE
jgi:hypothetical protein